MPYTVIRDTREKDDKGWRWIKSKYCTGTIEQKMDTGDYTLEGLEHFIVIERKGSVSEWAHNVLEKRFENELTRLNDFPHSFILLEFGIDDIMRYPIGSGVSKYRTKIRGSFLLRRTIEIIMRNNINIIFCQNKGKDIATSIFKRAFEMAN
jgi:hypothetical protein